MAYLFLKYVLFFFSIPLNVVTFGQVINFCFDASKEGKFHCMLQPVIQRRVNANPGLKLNPLI